FRLGAAKESFEERGRQCEFRGVRPGRLGNKEARQGRVFELPLVRDVVCRLEPGVMRACATVEEPAVSDLQAGSDGRHRMDVRRELAEIEALRFGEQRERCVEVALRLEDA